MKFYENLGAHISTAGGIGKIFKTAEELKINNIQCFTASNVQWSFKKEIDEKILEKYLKEREKFELTYGKANVFSHGCYLTNLASDKEDIKKKSEESLIAELHRCNLLKIDGIVFHPGSNKDKKLGIKNISDSIKKISDESPDNIKIFLENSAGAGSSLPSNLDEISELFYACNKVSKKIGIVIDTCHAHVAGYDFSEKEIQENFWKNLDKNVGIKNLGFIHLNDSKKNCGSKADRHENIGNGTIKNIGFEILMKNKILNSVIKIIETPFFDIDSYKNDLKNIEKLK